MWWNKSRRLWKVTHEEDVNTTLLSGERAQGLIEFAITLPVLMLLLLGTLDLGMGFRTYIGLTNAAREGVRWISIHPTDQSGAKDRIAEESGRIGVEDAELSEGGYEVTFSPDQSDYTAGDKVTVNVSYKYELLFGIFTGLPEIPFVASSTMVVLYDE